MPRQTQNILLSFLIFSILLAILSLSACKEDEEEDDFSQEDFVNALTGEWHVLIFWRTPIYPPQTDFIQCSKINDSVQYRFVNTINIYAINDPELCALPEIDNMQNWTISEDNDELTLKAIDLCGKIRSYKIEYSSIKYKEGEDWHQISAEVSLINTDTTWYLSEFRFSDTYLQFSAANDSLSLYDYVLSR